MAVRGADRRLVVALALVGLAACGAGGGGRTAPDAPAGHRAGDVLVVLVVLQRYGGVAGITERVAVDSSGLATVLSDRSPSSTVRALPSGDLDALRTALERSQIATLQRNYLDTRAADAYQYDLSYQGVTVTADEGVLPPTLRPVVDLLVRLLG